MLEIVLGILSGILDGAKINLQVEKKHWPYQLIG
jgi:hypothetical protein